ncbi:MAG TPA: four helix bundle protein [Tepidiformaceae bacterium]|nr:four helix bundle protein [Tepidiformaceae bacterium]
MAPLPAAGVLAKIATAKEWWRGKAGWNHERALVPTRSALFVCRSVGVSEYRSHGIARSYRDLTVYSQAFEAAMAIFELTKTFPAEERYSLVDQMRRSSRSVCANIAEAWRKRRYRQAFIAKLSDAESEAAETQVWLQFTEACGYAHPDRTKALEATYEGVLAQLVAMIAGADRWVVRTRG